MEALFYYLDSYRVNFYYQIRMQVHVDNAIRKDIKHIIAMQTLLEEYDRQNKFLNRQVLGLLQENKVLKISNVKSNIINRLPSKDGNRIKGSLPNQRTIIEENKQTLKSVVFKKDEAVQVTDRNIIEPQRNIVIPDTKINYEKTKKEGQYFSFGVNQDLKSKQTIELKGSNMICQNIQESQICYQSKNQRTIEKSRFKTDVSWNGIQKKCNQSNILNDLSKKHIVLQENQKGKTLLKQKSTRRMRSNHSLKPSPNLTPNKQKNPFVTPSSSKMFITEFESKEKVRFSKSGQKRKKFIDIISLQTTPLKIKMLTQSHDCC